MSNEAANKLATSTIDTRIVLNLAFSNLLSRPELVADYEDLSITAGGLNLQLFNFRIGYASFLLMIIDSIDDFIVLDFDVQDGDSVHLDRSLAVALPPPATPAPP